MPNDVKKVTDSYFGGFTSVDRLIESYQPPDPQNFERTARLIKEGRLSEAANLHQENLRKARLGEAMVKDDLPILLGGSIDTQIRKGFDTITANWKLAFPEVPYSNFRQQKLDKLEDIVADDQQGNVTPSGTLPMVPESGQYSDVRFSEDYEYAQLNTYGGIFQITRHMLYDDNLRALQQIPQKMGVLMARTINKHIADCLEASASTSTAGALMQDGSRLFNTTAPSGSIINMYTAAAPITVATLMTYLANFANYTTPQGRVMNMRPKWLIVAPERQFVAEQICGVNATTPQRLIDGTATARQTDNAWPMGMLTPLVIEELTQPADWMLATDSAIYSTLEVGFLNGRSAPEVFSKSETALDLHAADGMQYKIRLDFDVYAVDRRGLLRVDDTT